MINKFNLLVLGCLLVLNSAIAQNLKLEQVTIEELEMVKDSVFEDAVAIVLNRNVSVKVGKYVEVYEKIKILKENGLDYATIIFPYYDAYNIDGYTYNLVNGEIQQTKLNKDMIFTDKIKHKATTLRDKKAAFAKVKVGSIIEIHYKTNRGSYSDICMQYNIPIKKLSIEIGNSSTASYRFAQNPMAYLKMKHQNSRNKVLMTTENVPPLEHENYVFDMELFRAKIMPRRIGYTGSKIDEWKDISKYLSKRKEYKKQLKTNSCYQNDIITLTYGIKEPLKRVELIYNYLKENIEWNGDFGIFPDRGTESTFNLKKGDVSDINLLFVSMLRSIGIESYPILASSKMNGIHLEASQEAFNYTLTGAKILDEWHIFDPASPLATFDYIPKYMINWKGMMVKDNGTFEWIDLSTPKISKKSIIATTVLDDHFVFTGKVRERQTGHFGIDMRHLIKNSNVEKDSLIRFNQENLQFKNIDIDINSTNANTNITYEFSLEDSVEELGNEIHVTPLNFLAISENPFKTDFRQFHVDFGYSYSLDYIFSIKLPKGYKATYIPEPRNISMPNNLGSYFYKITAQGDNLQVLMKLKINQPIIKLEYYQELKEFFKIRVQKENEKVILELK